MEKKTYPVLARDCEKCCTTVQTDPSGTGSCPDCGCEYVVEKLNDDFLVVWVLEQWIDDGPALDEE